MENAAVAEKLVSKNPSSGELQEGSLPSQKAPILPFPRKSDKVEGDTFGNCKEVVERYAPLVKRIAIRLLLKMPPNVDVNDFIQAGMIGLLEAAIRYDVSKGASFETYAGIRIHGSMLDEVRKGDWTPRSVYRKSRKLAEAVKAIEGRTGHNATNQEIADELGIDLNAYYAILEDSTGAHLFSFDALMGDDNDSVLEFAVGGLPGPCDELQKETFRAHLRRAIDMLPEREKLVLALYYDEELNLREIGEVISGEPMQIHHPVGVAAKHHKVHIGHWWVIAVKACLSGWGGLTPRCEKVRNPSLN